MRTSRESKGAKIHKAAAKVKTLRIVLVPTFSAIGPATAIPIGASASDPSTS